MNRSSMKSRFANAEITRGALILLVVSTACSLVYFLANDAIRAELVTWVIATPKSIWNDFKFWQLLSSPLLETQFVSVLLHGFMLWKFFPQLERWWGKKRFLLFALYTSLVGVLAGTLVGYFFGDTSATVSGLSPFVFGGLIAFGRMFANEKVQFFGVLPLTGKQLTIGIAGFALVFLLFGQEWARGAAMLSAMALAFVMTQEKFSLKLWNLKRKQAKIKRQLKVVDGGQKDAPPKKWMN